MYYCNGSYYHWLGNNCSLFTEMIDYQIRKITAKEAKDYIHKYHYSHGSMNSPAPCYGLFEGENLIGALMFATPASENVRACVFGKEFVDHVTELHRLHILDVTPRNTESWFISRCLKLLKEDKPKIWAVLSFSDTTEGHNGTIYKATNAYRCGKTTKAKFYLDQDGRLRHPRQCGVNIKTEDAERMGWTSVMRQAKNRYLWLLPDCSTHNTKLKRMCLLNLDDR